jgi:tetrahedral aminopeptidase
MDLTTFLKKLISLPGLSGYEDPVREIIAEAWRPLVDELSISRTGSLHGLKRGEGPDPRPSVLLAVHMDAIGLMVTQVTEEGFLRFTAIGGVDPRILASTPVKVHASGRGTPGLVEGAAPHPETRALPGIVVQPPDLLLPPSQKGRPVKMEHLLVDMGLEADVVRALVRVGDLISYDTDPIDLSGDAISGHTLDNRVSVAAVTGCLDELRQVRHAWNVTAVATVQEEVTYLGGYTSAFEIKPTIAVVVDVTFARGPGVSGDYRAFPLGKGLTIVWGPQVHPALFDAFKTLADQLDVPYTVEVTVSPRGTDAFPIQATEGGIPTVVLGIPLRYMHTPVEVVSMKDVNRTAHLLAQFIAGLDDAFVDQIKYED